MTEEEKRKGKKEIKRLNIEQYEIQEKPAPAEIDQAVKEIEDSIERKKKMKL